MYLTDRQRAAFERIEPSPEQSWTFFRRRGVFDFSWHFHPEYELTLIERGTGTRFVGDSVEDYRPGDLVLIGPNLPHTYVGTGPGEASCAQFTNDLLGAGWTDRPEFSGVARLLERAARGVAVHVEPEEWPRLDHLAPARRTLRLVEVLVALSERADLGQLAAEGHTPAVDRATMSRLDALVTHIAANLAEPITLDQLAGVAHLSAAGTSRFFRRQTGVTLTAYVNRMRIAEACRALSDPELAIADVAHRAGYGNLSHFNREFKRRTGRTPRQFRAELQPQPDGLDDSTGGARPLTAQVWDLTTSCASRFGGR